MSSIWWDELKRIALLMAGGLIIGLVSGKVAIWLALALAGYLFWHLMQLYRLERWFAEGRSTALPEAPGIWGEIYNHLHRLLRRNRERKQHLARLLREFRDATEALPEGAVVLDRAWEIRWFNDAAIAMLGLRPQDVGQPLVNLVRQPRFARYLQAGNFREPLEIVAPADAERRLMLHVVPYGDEHRLLLLRDHTRLYRLERMRREFVANASHELRSPLTVIGGYLEALMEDPAIADTWRQPIAEMRRQAVRMTAIVNDLLELSRLETEAEDAPRETIDVCGLVSRIREEALALGEGPADVRLELETTARLAGSEKEIHSAFSNLVFNAMRYTPEEGLVRLRWYRDGGHACFAVIDTGIGIPPEHIPRLTERFYRVDSARTRAKGGTGLGLAIVKHVLQRHGATLRIESEEGRGSVFTCVFPAARVLE